MEEKKSFEIQHSEDEKKRKEEKRPGNKLPRWQMFEQKLDRTEGENQVIGFTDPEGEYYSLEEGEELVHEKEGDGPERKTFIRTESGAKISFDEWKLLKKDSNERKANQNETIDYLLNELDRDLLKDIVKNTGEQRYYGKDFELNYEMRNQIEVVAKAMQEYLKENKEGREWQELEELIDEGDKKGVLMSFAGFPPRWLVDGGENSPIKKVRTEDGSPGIQVSTEIYNLYYWDGIANSLTKEAKTSNDGLKGRSTSFLNENLRNVSLFFKKNNLIK